MDKICKGYIFATAAQKRKLADHFKVSITSVSLALRFKRNSSLSQSIRERAINVYQCVGIIQ